WGLGALGRGGPCCRQFHHSCTDPWCLCRFGGRRSDCSGSGLEIHPHKPSTLRQEWSKLSLAFATVDDVAHAFKHVKAGNPVNSDLQAKQIVAVPASFDAASFSCAPLKYCCASPFLIWRPLRSSPSRRIAMWSKFHRYWTGVNGSGNTRRT